jgi:hypothetical protein
VLPERLVFDSDEHAVYRTINRGGSFFSGASGRRFLIHTARRVIVVHTPHKLIWGNWVLLRGDPRCGESVTIAVRYPGITRSFLASLVEAGFDVRQDRMPLAELDQKIRNRRISYE